jgi:hypothetical protein
MSEPQLIIRVPDCYDLFRLGEDVYIVYSYPHVEIGVGVEADILHDECSSGNIIIIFRVHNSIITNPHDLIAMG